MTQSSWLKTWGKKGTRLFIVEGDIKTFAPCTGVSTITWEPGEKPKALLHGCPTTSPALARLTAGFDLEIQHSLCGNPDAQAEENVIIKLYTCSVKRMYFDNPVVLDPWQSDEAVMLYVLVEADEMGIIPENG